MVHVLRENEVESVHRGVVAVVNDDGKLIAHAGNPDQLIFARSTIKPIIALPLLIDGAAERYQLTDEELAVVSSSHSGQSRHVEAVLSIINKIGMTEQDLHCGIHDPWHTQSKVALKERGEPSTQLHNNCSGKHAGMLAWCKAKNADPEGYIDGKHPVQRRIKETVALLAGMNEEDIKTGVDGCGVPVFYMPVQKLAYAMAQLGNPIHLPAEWQSACKRMTKAIQKHPFYLGGDGRFETELMRVTNSRLIGKSGAEGVFVTICPDRGWALALKMEDGGNRGLFPAVMETLIQMDQLSKKEIEALDEFYNYDLKNWAGTTVGQVHPVFTLNQSNS